MKTKNWKKDKNNRAGYLLWSPRILKISVKMLPRPKIQEHTEVLCLKKLASFLKAGFVLDVSNNFAKILRATFYFIK